MTIKLDEDNITVSPTQIDDTDSPYLTNGEQYIYVDTTDGPVTIQLASSDTVDGAEIRIIDTGESASANPITIQTEGTENINPGSNSSITLTVDGTYVDLFSDGSNWFSDRAVTSLFHQQRYQPCPWALRGFALLRRRGQYLRCLASCGQRYTPLRDCL